MEFALAGGSDYWRGSSPTMRAFPDAARTRQNREGRHMNPLTSQLMGTFLTLLTIVEGNPHRRGILCEIVLSIDSLDYLGFC